jgi:hypothetical protein
MGIQNYAVEYSTDGVNYTALTNVQEIQLFTGRQSQLDQIKTTTASFTLRYPTGYVSPIAALVSGTKIRFRNLTNVVIFWFGEIADVTVEYGIPFSSGVGPADYVTVSCEGLFAKLGRMTGNDYVMPADSAYDQSVFASTETGVTVEFLTGTVNAQYAGTTVSTTWGDWLAKTALTTNSRMWEDSGIVTIVSPFYTAVSPYNFSDTANDGSNNVYNKINFGSLSDNFYTQVSVSPESFATQIVTKAGATVPYRTYQVNTFNASASQALDYSNYLLGNYGESRFAITSISCIAEAQNTFRLANMGEGGNIARAPGTQVNVVFRGTTFVCLIEGVAMTATPESSTYTYYLSGADLNAYLRLNYNDFGRLDFNKLGY